MSDETHYDVLVVGAGPAGLAITAALAERGLAVAGLTLHDPAAPWPNTYGIWEDELASLGLTHFLAHRWTDCVSYTAAGQIRHDRVYGLIDRPRLQAHLLDRARRAGVLWHRGAATAAVQHPAHTKVHTGEGTALEARLVVDASGHRPALLHRPPAENVALQAAYGIVGRFSAPPVDEGQMVIMDYRADHLNADQRRGPPTFLYAMDLGDGRHFVEETSLAHAPPVSYEVLERRLYRRLAHRGIEVLEVEEVEHCLFPMNPPLPDLTQPMLGYGGAAGMVHPASGYQVGGALRRAGGVADAVARALGDPQASPTEAARSGWEALWPADRRRKRQLYLFGLENVMEFDVDQTHAFFRTFFELPYPQWSGYLSDTLSVAGLLHTMWTLFARAPMGIRRALGGSMVTGYPYLWRALRGTS